LNVATNDEICAKLYNDVRKEHPTGGKDMVDSLKGGVRIAMGSQKPKLSLKTIYDKDTAALKATKVSDNTIATTEYNAAYKTWEARNRHLLELESAVYALIFTKYCTYKMQDKILELPQFEMEIDQDPYKLLETAKLLTHQTTLKKTHDYMWSLVSRELFACKQHEHESPKEYHKHFKQKLDNFTSQCGSRIIEDGAKETQEYKDYQGTKTDCLTEQFNRFCAYVFLENTNKSYQPLFRDLSVQYAMDNDKYPKTIDTALDILDAYTASIPRKPKSDKPGKPSTPNTPNDTNTDDQGGTNETSFAQTPKRCFCCGETDHLSSTCSKKKTTPKSEWYINQAVNMFESSSRSPSTSAPATSDGRSV